jgi:CDP-diacylglycerol--glycerol-3-phosphate 3-phosphatidyltransferase
MRAANFMTPRVARLTILLTFAGVTLITVVAKGFASYDASVDCSLFVPGATVAWLSIVFFLAQLRRAHSAEGRGALSSATWVTIVRGFLICLVAGFASGRVPAGRALWLPGALYTLAALADRADGAHARRTAGVTPLGAKLDVTTDALGLLVAPLVGVRWGRLPPWYLALALAYPALRLALGLLRAFGRPTFPERLRLDPRARFFAGVQMTVVATALFPLLPRAFTWTAATVAMLPTLALFAGEWRLVTRSAADGDAAADRLHP